MIDQSAFVAACRAALRSDPLLPALGAVVQAAVRDPAQLQELIPAQPVLRVSVWTDEPGLCVAVLISPPGFTFPPHEHLMPSVVGVFSGVEENIYYRRSGRGLVEIGRRRVDAGQAVAHDEDVIHSISNGSHDALGAIHVYAGDFFRKPRSEWSTDLSGEHPYDLARVRRLIDGGSGQGLPASST
jgi:predicted metal-dependent enzyme (double-stranded beta helix superfamily)